MPSLEGCDPGFAWERTLRRAPPSQLIIGLAHLMCMEVRTLGLSLNSRLVRVQHRAHSPPRLTHCLSSNPSSTKCDL